MYIKGFRSMAVGVREDFVQKKGIIVKRQKMLKGGKIKKKRKKEACFPILTELDCIFKTQLWP